METSIPTVDEVLKKCVAAFKEKFGADPAVAACAPGRVNLIGEHTDYNDGFVFPMALPMVTVVVGRKTDSGKCRVMTLASEEAKGNLDEFPAGKGVAKGDLKWANYVRGVVANFPGEIPSFDAALVSSVPIGGGVSSSASLEVATFTFLEALTSHKVDNVAKAKACQKAEHEYAGMPCGIMDQFIATMGQHGNALLIDCRSLATQQVPLDDPGVVVLVTNSNVRHELTGSEYPTRRNQCRAAAEALGAPSLRDVTQQQLEDGKGKMDEVTFRRARHVVGEIERTSEAVRVLTESKDYKRFGQLMVQSHNSLRDDFEVSCAELDLLVEAAMQVEGVYGSRMTGGGFGGCTVTLVTKAAVQKAIEKMDERYRRERGDDQGRATFYVCAACEGARQLQLRVV